MTDSTKPVCIIPARAGSRRLPNKPMLKLNGISLLAHVINAAFESEIFRTVAVSTESTEIMHEAEAHGAIVHWRVDWLAEYERGVVDICLESLKHFTPNVPKEFCCLYSTAALIEPEDIVEAYKAMTMNNSLAACVGVSRYPYNPTRRLAIVEGRLRPDDKLRHSFRDQETGDFVAANGSIYWSRTDVLRHCHTFFTKETTYHLMPPWRGIDVNTEEDYEMMKRIAG